MQQASGPKAISLAFALLVVGALEQPRVQQVLQVQDEKWGFS